MAYEDYHVNADDVKLDGDPNIRRTVPPSPSGGGGGIAYGTCTTAAATAAKVVTLADATGWELKQGATICIKFTNTNTAQNPTLNVNNSGAKSIYYNRALITTGSLWVAGENDRYTTFMYDGTYWVWIGSSIDRNTTYSNMSTSELTTGTATTSRVVRADYLHAGIKQIAKSAEIDTANNTATFTSSDVADGSATSWTSVSKLNSGETHSSIFAKVSQMFKNIRYLYKMLGTTDISSIGDGTVTGGLDTLKDHLNDNEYVKVGQVSGTTSITLPTDWKDLQAICQYGNSSGIQPQATTFNAHNSYPYLGAVLSSGSGTIESQIMVSNNGSSISMTYFGVGGTNYTSTSRMSVFARK